MCIAPPAAPTNLPNETVFLFLVTHLIQHRDHLKQFVIDMEVCRRGRLGSRVLKSSNESSHIHLQVAYFSTVVLMRERHPAC